MRSRWGVVFLCAVAVSLSFAAPASAERPLPSRYTTAFAQQVHDAGAAGVTVARERLNTECPGVRGPGVSAAGCIVAPAGCTADCIFASGSTRYVGTARHCVDRIGQEVTMQVDTTTLATVGTVSHMTPGDGEPGNDWALIQIVPDFTHLIVDIGTYPGSTLAGTRITNALSRFGVSPVSADGSLTGAAGTSC